MHLFERECSIQRRHQKIVEESPSPGATPATLERDVRRGRRRWRRAIGYVGAGTVEFLVSGEGDAQEFFFLEMNTRLQVEHPVTEMVTGLDLVAWQLAVAQGEPLPLAQDEIARSGHAIEVRLYAEDPARDFLPSTGTLAALGPRGVRRRLAARRQRRSSRAASSRPFYDPMLAKVIAHGADASTDAALALARTCATSAVVGVDHEPADARRDPRAAPAFLAGDTTTAFLDEHPELLVAAACPADVRGARTCAAAALRAARCDDAGFRNVARRTPETLRVVLPRRRRRA